MLARPRPITAHLRSESGPTLTRFALEAARLAGGDVLWLAYIPDGLHSWFHRFADSVDPGLGPDCPFRVIRLFDAPSAADIAFLLSLIRSRRSTDHAGALVIEDIGSPDARAAATEINQGRLHFGTVLLDVHHLGTFLQKLRASGAVGAATVPVPRPIDPLTATAVAGLSVLLDSLKAAGLNVLATIALAGRTSPGRTGSKQSAEGAILDAIDAKVDLAAVIGVNPPPADRPGQIQVWINASAFPELTPTQEFVWVDRSELTAVWRQGVGWRERLACAVPRTDIAATATIRESAGGWPDPTKDEFARWATARNWTVTPASADQDRGEHWDLCISRGHEQYRVDVKGQSRIRRADAAPQDDWHWVELRGVVDDGWLLSGCADLVAFQTRGSFVLVKRSALIAHVCHHVAPDDVVSEQRQAEYRVYHRKDATRRTSIRATGSDRGVLTLVPTNRLRQIAFDEWVGDIPDAVRG